MKNCTFVVLAPLLIGCGAGRPAFMPGGDAASMFPGPDLAQAPGRDAGPAQSGCGELSGCYTVYAHSDHVLYRLDLGKKLIVAIGPFNAPKVNGVEDGITDLAVAPDDTVYVISKTNLYTADKSTGQVTLVSPVNACGSYAVALTFMPDGKLYAGDHKGAFCRIDVSTMPPKVTLLGMIGGGMGLAGDLVAVADGTMYGTVYTVKDFTTESNNSLVKIDPATGAISQTIGPTGFPRLFGIAFEGGQVFAFTGDGTGDVVTVDPKTGKGTLYGAFNDPNTNMPITFGGAGVNAMVSPTIM